MSGVYIKGMDVPDINDYNGISCCLYKTLGGQLRLRNNETGQFFDVDTVPPHGRLGDLDALIGKIVAKYLDHERKGELVFAAAEIKQDIIDLISDSPTIIPAEEGE